MQVRKLSVAGVVGLGSFLALSLSVPAYALCDPYSGACPSTPPAGDGIGGTDEQPVSGVDEEPAGTTDEGTSGGDNPVRGNTSTPATVTNTPATLPFTGGELVLLTAVGVGALAGGTALVIAGRRRGATA